MDDLKLCAYSQSEILDHLIIATCPLGLKKSESAKCPCKKYVYHVPPADLRVGSCVFPNTHYGDRINNPEAFAKSLKIDRKASQRERSFEKMTANATADPPKSDQQSKSLITSKSPPGAIALYSKIADPMDFIGKMGGTLYESKMFGLSNAAQGRALVWNFWLRNEDPFEFRARHHIIGGNITMSSEAMLADFRTELGGSHRIVTRTPSKAAIELTLGKQKQLFEFTWDEAREEDYVYTKDGNDGKVPKTLPDGKPNPAALKDNWKTPRRRMQMLWARVVSDAVGAVAPEIAGGKLTPEELGVFAADDTLANMPAAATPPTGAAAAAASGPAAGEVIDGDFTVVNDELPEKQPEISVSASDEAAPAAAAATQPSSPPFDAGPEPTADKPSPPASPSTPSTAERKMALLRELKALKEELMTPEKYAEVLDKKGVKSATELDLAALEKMVSGLRNRKAQKAGTDELSQWAEGALKPKAEGGQAGN